MSGCVVYEVTVISNPGRVPTRVIGHSCTVPTGDKGYVTQMKDDGDCLKAVPMMYISEVKIFKSEL